MKLPTCILRDYVSTELTAEQLGDLLTMAGFELEELIEVEGEPVLDIKVMANRGDGLSAFGLAREVLAKDGAAKPTELYIRAASRLPASDASQPIRLADGREPEVHIRTEDCTRYACRAFEEVENGVSPEWLQMRLRQAGQRPISLLVDLTNYVMLEVGQPLHAFDYDALKGGRIVVRKAEPGETLETLNGQSHELRADQMMICDGDRPVAAAGVMGGAETEVGPGTRTMLLESAHFVNTSIRRTRKQMGLSTEASYRFERSVDPEGVVAALNRFAELYSQVTGKACVPGVVDLYPTPPVRSTVAVRTSRAAQMMGYDLEPAQVESYLTRLGFEVSGEGEPFVVASPSWRPDIVREIDLVEEIGRVHGYERIPDRMPQGSTPQGGVFGLPRLIDKVRETALRCGYDQVMNHTLRDDHPLDFHPEWRVGPRNPHSPEAALLRDSLLPGLTESATRNGGRNLSLFEIGRVFLKGDYQTDESPEFAVISTGSLFQPHWGGKETAQADFFSIKGLIEEIAGALDIPITFDLPRIPDRRFHPTKQSGVLVDHGLLWAGTIGQIHPDYAEQTGLPEETYMAELDLYVLHIATRQPTTLKPISRNPAVRRDMAFVVSKAVPYSQIEQTLAQACGEDLEKHWLFDVYEGKGIPEGSHSLAVALQLRRMGANLTDDDANAIRDRAVKALETLGATLR